MTAAAPAAAAAYQTRSSTPRILVLHLRVRDLDNRLGHAGQPAAGSSVAHTAAREGRSAR